MVQISKGETVCPSRLPYLFELKDFFMQMVKVDVVLLDDLLCIFSKKKKKISRSTLWLRCEDDKHRSDDIAA